MKKRLLKLALVFFAGPVQASASCEDSSPVVGRPHQAQLAYFKTLREEEAASFIRPACTKCNEDRHTTGHYLVRHYNPRKETEDQVCQGGASGPHCCKSVKAQAHLLKVQRLSPDVTERLDLLAKASVLHASGQVRLSKTEAMLSYFLEGFAGWEKMHTQTNAELIFCRAVYAYLSKALLEEMWAHQGIQSLSFISKGIHPLLLPALEGFAKRGSGPTSLSFGRRHLCHCRDEEEGALHSLNMSLHQMSFVTHVSYGDHFLKTHAGITTASKTLAALLSGTYVTHLTLYNDSGDFHHPLTLGHDLLFATQEEDKQKHRGTVRLCAQDCDILKTSLLQSLTLCGPGQGTDLMALPSFGAFLKESPTLRTLALYGNAYAQGEKAKNAQTFVESVLGSHSLTNVIFEGPLAHVSFGLSDTERGAIETRLARNREAQGTDSVTSSS